MSWYLPLLTILSQLPLVFRLVAQVLISHGDRQRYSRQLSGNSSSFWLHGLLYLMPGVPNLFYGPHLLKNFTQTSHPHIYFVLKYKLTDSTHILCNDNLDSWVLFVVFFLIILSWLFFYSIFPNLMMETGLPKRWIYFSKNKNVIPGKTFCPIHTFSSGDGPVT